MNMTFTALSQIAEQVIKLATGLFAASIFMPDVKKAVAGATLAITVSEFFALCLLLVCYAIHKKKKRLNGLGLNKSTFIVSLKQILFYAVPITLTGVMLPLSKVIDSFLMVNLMSGYSENPTALYGIFSGVAATVIGLPVAVCYGISTVAIPALSSSKSGVPRWPPFSIYFLTISFKITSLSLELENVLP